MTKNDITGDQLKSKPQSDAYRDGWDRIFKSPQERDDAIAEDEAFDAVEAQQPSTDVQSLHRLD